MSNIFVISDTHFAHANILSFVYDDNGVSKHVRPGFKDVDHMNQTMIDNWNRVVMPNDKVYHLGDFTFGNPRNIEKFAKQLNGHKRLVLGNHDYEAKLYYPYFEKVMSWRQFGGKQFKRPVVLTHFPLHESSFAYRTGSTGVNIHGHIHQNKLPLPWVNVCVEHRQYTPISIEDLLDSI